MLDILFGNRRIHDVKSCTSYHSIKQICSSSIGLSTQDFYLLQNGRLVNEDPILENGPLQIIPRLVGGKGGFGSMLRAIGAQIEKTTNREACRDLSGRRLRDINEEKRLKTWINQQVEREKEAAERRQKKLEKLCEKPKYEFKDETYDKERSDLPEKVEDAVLQGLKAAPVAEKRKQPLPSTVQKKKRKLWFDADMDDDLSSDSDASDVEVDINNKLTKNSAQENEDPDLNTNEKTIQNRTNTEIQANEGVDLHTVKKTTDNATLDAVTQESEAVSKTS